MIILIFSLLLVGHPIKHGRLKVHVTAREMVNDCSGDDDNNVQEKLSRSVCQTVKVRVFETHHACSSCQSEDCSSAEMSMFKHVSILLVSFTSSSSCSSTRLSHPPPFTTSIDGILSLVSLVIFSYQPWEKSLIAIFVLPVR